MAQAAKEARWGSSESRADASGVALRAVDADAASERLAGILHAGQPHLGELAPGEPGDAEYLDARHLELDPDDEPAPTQRSPQWTEGDTEPPPPPVTEVRFSRARATPPFVLSLVEVW